MRHAASSGKQDAMHPTNRVTRLEDLLSNATVQGILPDQSVTVISVQWFGSEALELTYKMANGTLPIDCCIAPTSHDSRWWNMAGHGALTGMDIFSDCSQRPIESGWRTCSTPCSRCTPRSSNRCRTISPRFMNQCSPGSRYGFFSPTTPAQARRSWLDC
jgi:hypothetical protein